MFSEEYDRTLWLMLVSDKVGRDSLVSFIKDIPLECYSEIHEMINRYKETSCFQSINLEKMVNDGFWKLCFNAYVFEDGELSLMIRKYRSEDKVIKSSEFMVKLMPANINLPIMSSDRYIGEIRDVKRNVVGDTIANYDDSIFEVSYERKFDLRRTPVGYYVSIESDCLIEPNNVIKNLEQHVKYKNKVVVSKIPEKMYVHQFESDKRVSRLIRGKKRNIIRSK